MSWEKIEYRRITALALLGASLFTLVIALMPRRTQHVFTGYVMMHSPGPGALQVQIANSTDWAWLAPMSCYVIPGEYHIQVWQRQGNWSLPVLNFRVSRGDYERFSPPAHVAIYFEDDGDDIVVTKVEPYEGW